MEKIRWGILGCGRIARKFAADLALVESGTLVAIGSRSAASANAFAAEFPVPHVHLDYESLATDPGVDVIYIASPHGQHYEHTLLCLRHGKEVLCEKAFALHRSQVQEMVDMARSRELFLMAAL